MIKYFKNLFDLFDYVLNLDLDVVEYIKISSSENKFKVEVIY